MSKKLRQRIQVRCNLSRTGLFLHMPRYFFHIRDHDRMILDDEGLELASVSDAIREARNELEEMVIDSARDGDNISHQVMEVTDHTGRVLASIPFGRRPNGSS